MSDTPRTDAHTRQLIDTLQRPYWIEFARQLERENAALKAALEAITRSRPIMGSKGHYREGQLHALEVCSKVARAAIDAAMKETK